MFNSFKFLWNSTPPYLIYWVTQNCNFTCDHCFNYIENQKSNFDLSLEEVERFSSNLKHLKYVTLAGGEPMIRKDLAQIAEIFYRNNGLQMLNVVTNGWFTDRIVLFAQTVLARCPQLSIAINVSIDGLRETHDRIRQKEGSFDRAIETLHALKEIAKTPEGQRLSISSSGTYNAANAETILDIAHFIREKVGVPYFMTLIRGEDVQNNSLKKIDINHYRKVAEQLLMIGREKLSRNYPFRNVRLAVNQTVTDIIYDSFKHDKMTVPCKAGEKGFVMTANGEILLCEVLDIRLGNIRQHDYDPMKILQSPKAMQEMQKILKEKCHCTWECFQTMNAVFSPSLYPKIGMRALRNMLPVSGKIEDSKPDWQSATFRPNALATKAAAKQTTPS